MNLEVNIEENQEILEQLQSVIEMNENVVDKISELDDLIAENLSYIVIKKLAINNDDLLNLHKNTSLDYLNGLSDMIKKHDKLVIDTDLIQKTEIEKG